MATLEFAFGPDGMIVDVLLGIDGASITQLAATGQPIPPPQMVRGILDTGTNVTVVSAADLNQLKIIRRHTTKTQSFAGAVQVGAYQISLSITNLTQPGAPLFTQSSLPVIDMPGSLSGIDVLVGMDVLVDCKMLLDGPQRRFRIEF